MRNVQASTPYKSQQIIYHKTCASGEVVLYFMVARNSSLVAQPSGKSAPEMKVRFFRCSELKFGTDVAQGVLSWEPG